MIGKLIGAWIGGKIADRNIRAKGAILGAGAAALAKRGLPTIAAAAAGIWVAKKLYNRRRRISPAYPSEATPSSA